MTTFRPAWPEEASRVHHLLGNRLPAKGVQFFGALREQPIERFIGAVAWTPRSSPSSGSHDSSIAEFSWKMAPRFVGSPEEVELLKAFATHLEQSSIPPPQVKTGAMFAPNSRAHRILSEAGFRRRAKVVVCEADRTIATANRERFAKVFKHTDLSDYEIVPIAQEHFTEIRKRVGLEAGLVSLAQLDLTLSQPQSKARVFDAAWSYVVRRKSTGHLSGIFLAEVQGDKMHIPACIAFSGPEEIPGACLNLLFQHLFARCIEEARIETLLCRINPVANSSMYRLSQLLGFREVDIQESFEWPLLEASASISSEISTDAQ